jgi:chloramphenicol-sensitive protein RarD
MWERAYVGLGRRRFDITPILPNAEVMNHFSPSPLHSPIHLSAAASAGAANVILGASSLYWRELSDVPPQVLVAYRVLLSLLLLALLIFPARGLRDFKHLTPRAFLLHCAASMLIATNWGVFIWASINGHILESGFGYLLAPCLSIAMGALVYREPLTPTQSLSVLLIFASAAFMAIYSELNHWVYVLIAVTWGTYTCFKKTASLTVVSGLFVETAFLSLCLVLAIAVFNWTLVWPASLSARSGWLIWLAGGVSVLPLLLFSYSAGKLALSMTGFFQFILPITQVAVALLFYRQSIAMSTLILFMSTTGALVLLLAYELISSKRVSR